MFSWILSTRNDLYGGEVPGVPNPTMKRLIVTVESILRLPGEHEVIVVDFCSSGPVAAYLTDYPSVKVVTVKKEAIDLLQAESGDERLTFYEYLAKDIGVKTSKGDYLIICNPDNVFPAKMFDLVETAREKGYIARAARYEIDRDILTEDVKEIVDRGDTGEFIIMGEFMTAAGDFTGISRKTYNKLGGYLMVHGNWHLDNEFIKRAMKAGHTVSLAYKHYHINHDDAIDSPSKNKDWRSFKKIEPKTLEKIYELAQV